MNHIKILTLLISLSVSSLFAQTTINFNLPKYKDYVSYDATQLYDEVKYLILETNENCIIGQIEKIIKTDSTILILHSTGSNSQLIQFSLKSGDFINAIGKHGQGPGEYNRIFDFDFFDAVVYILDSSSRKILKYSLANEFIGAIDDPFMSRGIGVLDRDNIYLFLTPMGYLEHKPHSIALISSTGKIKNMLLPLDKDFIETADMYPFIRSKEGLLFSRGPDNCIYLINNNGVHLKWIVDFGKDNFLLKGRGYQMDKMGRTKKNWLMDVMASKKPHRPHDFYYDGDNIYFQFAWVNYIYSGFYNANSKALAFGNKFDDHGYQELQGSSVVGSSYNCMIRASFMTYFIDNYKRRFIDEGKELMSTPINNHPKDLSVLKADSNPVIFFTTLKSF